MKNYAEFLGLDAEAIIARYNSQEISLEEGLIASNIQAKAQEKTVMVSAGPEREKETRLYTRERKKESYVGRIGGAVNSTTVRQQTAKGSACSLADLAGGAHRLCGFLSHHHCCAA